ncbi:hypothetical protein BGZ82_000401, partial [Podila clonocystis]
SFPKHRPKMDLAKPDPLAAFLTAKNDVFVDTAPSISSSTPSRKRMILDPILSGEHGVRISSKRKLPSPKTASNPSK